MVFSTWLFCFFKSTSPINASDAAVSTVYSPFVCSIASTVGLTRQVFSSSTALRFWYPKRIHLQLSIFALHTQGCGNLSRPWKTFSVEIAVQEKNSFEKRILQILESWLLLLSLPPLEVDARQLHVPGSRCIHKASNIFQLNCHFGRLQHFKDFFYMLHVSLLQLGGNYDFVDVDDGFWLLYRGENSIRCFLKCFQGVFSPNRIFVYLYRP